MPLSETSPSPSGSPSPTFLPTPASSCSSFERSFSSYSSTSSQSSTSNLSTGTRSSSSSTARRRGYVRPQGISFADSAKNRESVMSLGSIAHLQYYFARTGLLDGKGGSMAKKKPNGEYEIPRLSLSEHEVVESPIEEEGHLLWEAAKEDGDEVMLPPTVSTYSYRDHHVPPPPDIKSLKKDLVDALEAALHSLESTMKPKTASEGQPEEEETQGFYEIEGLHILDTTTMAIRAARLYYTMHPNPARLNSIKSDYQLRRDLMSVMDVLKRMAGRKFAGGLREEERLSILLWVSEVGMMVDRETKLEDAERQERQGWQWMDDSAWKGREREREISFLNSLMRDNKTNSETLPEWVPATGTEPKTALLRYLADGRVLINMHNAAIKRSKKQFGAITTQHVDVAKPYRKAENLRFWVKAAQIRWETKLRFSVMTIANLADDFAEWSQFEDAIWTWSKVVRDELTQDWKGEDERKLQERAKSLAHASPAGSPTKSKISELHPHGSVQEGTKIPS